MATTNPPTTDIGQPDLSWGTWGQGLLTEWWETAPDLIWPQSVITYGRMRHDLQLRGVHSAYTLPIRRARWMIDGTGCREEVTKRVADQLGVSILGDDSQPGPARRRGVIWGRHLREALNYLTFGHMPFERRYAEEPDGFWGLANLGSRMPWTIAFMYVGTDGVMQSVVQTTQREPIPASRLVWYVHDQEGANWAGISPLRAAFGAWILKHETWRVHATSIRRFGMGVPSVEAPPGASAQMVQQANQLASSIRVSDQGGVGLPQGFKFMLQGMTGSAPDALAFIKYLDQAIAKSALAGLIELGQTETGSRALGETFLDLFLLSLQAIADEVAETATSGHPGMPGIITDLVNVNWGEDEPAPRLVCADVGENYQATAEAIGQLTRYGALQPDATLDEWIRKTWRLPPRPKGEAPPVVSPGHGEPPGGIPPSEEGLDTTPSPQGGPGNPGGRTPAAASGRRGKPSHLMAASGFQPDQHEGDWARQMETLLAAYKTDVVVKQRQELVDEVAASGGNHAKLALQPPGLYTGPDLILNAMLNMVQAGTRAVIEEAASQGVTIDPARVKADEAELSRIATARASLASSYMSQQASQKALQVHAADTSSDDESQQAADEVDAFLGGLSERSLYDQLGAALTAAQNTGRVGALAAAPESAGTAVYVATETLDNNTCQPCLSINGTVFDNLDDADRAYPGGGYEGCLGFARCRGTLYAVWGGVSLLD